ncbi:hypothetical protein [Alicyclobacillus macrosporangiidus]|uniref:hypothetical protein n=1 Tax=Alicyclobacillus macrosporangiidus TaxID=392015 RepID=UPI0018CC3EF2|nr:hypothetical protein [Alicyclobacillus macrosporangiidus]
MSSVGAILTTTLPAWLVTVSIGVWGYLALWIGNIAARSWLSRLLGDYGGITAGLMLVGVGMHQIV